MAMDMSKFHETYFEESLEGLELMETVLLELDPGNVDDEAINTIFRAAHSIKGGAGTFGFQFVSEFTHLVEALLEEMRAGERAVTTDAVNLLLSAVDRIRDLIEAARDGRDFDEVAVESIRSALGRALDAGQSPPSLPDVAPSPPGTPSPSRAGWGWRIDFVPEHHLLRTGNEPYRMFRELATLGTLTATVDLTRLPDWADLDPEECHLSWTLHLDGQTNREQIAEVFEWVDEDCLLDITEVGTGDDVPEEPSLIDPGAGDTRSTVPGSVASPGTSGPRTGDDLAGSSTPIPDRRGGGDRRQGPDRRGRAPQGSIRVSIDKIDDMINVVGELVITQSMLSELGDHFTMKRLDKLRDGLALLARNTRELQEGVMRIRMLPMSFAFNRFPRMVHDLSSKLGKKVELRMRGEGTELDKTVMEKINDPLVHLVRNALDHGIESPEARAAAGKPETGVLLLEAFQQGGNIMIEISDDGRGMDRERILARARERELVREDEVPPDEEIYNLVLLPGFSTAEEVSEVSGRGVGMDVVRRNILSLGGGIALRSEPGKGSTVSIRLPLTLAIMDGQNLRVGEHCYIMPLVSIVESIQLGPGDVRTVTNGAEVFRLREEYLPLHRLHDLFDVAPDSVEISDGLVVVVEGNGRKVGLFVDELLAQQQVVIKSLETNFKKVEGLSGATILGDGRVALILDVPGLIELGRQAAGRRVAMSVDPEDAPGSLLEEANEQ